MASTAFVVIYDTEDEYMQEVIGPFDSDEAAAQWLDDIDELAYKPVDGGYRHSLIVSAATATSPGVFVTENTYEDSDSCRPIGLRPDSDSAPNRVLRT